MGIAHTDLPIIHAGELKLAQHLLKITDNTVHFWFGINHIPCVKDIDMIIWHEKAGVFLVEVKAVDISQIESFGFGRCIIKGRTQRKGPQQQALDAFNALRNYLGPYVSKQPYITVTGCWPNISRERWNTHWDNPKICGEYSEKYLFLEDVYADHETFTSRLRHIASNPPVGSPWKHYESENSKLEQFHKAICPESKPTITIPRDVEKLRVIETKIRRKTREEAPHNGSGILIYAGHPGTGKTFRLLSIALDHAIHGRLVLFSCFNKVLGAEIRRMLNAADDLKRDDIYFEAMDVFELSTMIERMYQFGIDRKLSPSQQGKIILERFKEVENDFPKYNTVLVDEAQDMEDWQLELLQRVSTADATFCIAEGTGQELYNGKSEWLKNTRPQAKQKMLRRTFRNTKPSFEYAQLFYEAAPNVKRLNSAINKIIKEPMEYEIEDTNYFPVVKELDELSYDFDRTSPENAYSIWAAHKLEEYCQIIKNALERYKSDGTPVDLLILVPAEEDPVANRVIEALSKLGVPYMNYLDSKQRRSFAPQGSARITTFHSARGLEANRVIVFGLESLKDSSNLNSIGYIALSRSLYETIVVLNKPINELSDFCMQAYKQLQMKHVK
jgi:hypothetical protein